MVLQYFAMQRYELISFQTADSLAQAAAVAWLDEVERAKRAGRTHGVALSGGRITQNFFAAVVELAGRSAVSFSHVHFFWADERCVEPTDAESNYRCAREMFFEPLGILSHQIHRVRGEDAPETSAKSAAADLCGLVPLDKNGQPVLDLIFLGLGEDAHIASLFPGEPEALAASPSIYRAIANSPKPPPNRVTLGYPAIAAARKVWMLASGAGKEAALRASLSAGGRTPFARVLQMRDDTRIFTDIPSKYI